MQFQEQWLTDPAIFAVNRLPGHSDHDWYASEMDYYEQKNSRVVSLNGTWKFHYAENLKNRIAGFEEVGYDVRDWDDIQVPGHIQMQGYGTPMYVNIMYPWSGREGLKIGEVPEHFNPVGSYVRYFQLPDECLKHTIHLTFDGVECAFVVYLNGQLIGYSEDSFTPASFDITSAIKKGENKLAVQVFRFGSSSWLEDQDFWRFSGIFRDVYLSVLPDIHVSDLFIRQKFNKDFSKADISVKWQLQTSSQASIKVSLIDQDQKTVSAKEFNAEGSQGEFTLNVPDVHLWSAEDPYLYELRMSVYDESGTLSEIAAQKIGLRKFELKDGLMLLNGKRIIFNGVDRHEFCCTSGRVVDDETIYQDLLIMKRNNINAVRTSHYPNKSVFYRYCDALGIYVIDETNLETHGTWERPEEIFDFNQILPGDNEAYRLAVLDRARSMLERDKNHACILIWSCGNESFGGKTIKEMSDYFHAADPDRLVHYEGIYRDRRYPDTSDMESQMYTPASEIAQYLEQHDEKPFILCEYAHAMGNSNGGLSKYTDLIDQYEQYQGGFIWDFVDQAILHDGRLYYGGDFNERPSDFDFCGDGIVFADRKESPKMQEVKYCYQPFAIQVDPDTITIKNRFLFTDADKYDFIIVREDENGQKQVTLDVKLSPLMTSTLPNPFSKDEARGHYTDTVQVLLKKDQPWAKAGYEVAFGQYHGYVPYQKPVTVSVDHDLTVNYDGYTLGIIGDSFHAFFSSTGLVDYEVHHQQYLTGRLIKPNYFRPANNNDTYNLYGFRYGRWLEASQYAKVTYQGYKKRSGAVVVSYLYDLAFDSKDQTLLTYQVNRDGSIDVEMTYHPDKLCEPPEFGLMLAMPKRFSHVSYYGRGPKENYIDRMQGARIGHFTYEVDENFTPYLMPQECGARSDVYEAVISDDYGHGLMITGDAFMFSALRYTPLEIENASHQTELPQPYRTVLRIMKAQMGVGGDNTWGARTLDEYLLPKNEKITFTFKMKGIH